MQQERGPRKNKGKRRIPRVQNKFMISHLHGKDFDSFAQEHLTLSIAPPSKTFYLSALTSSLLASTVHLKETSALAQFVRQAAHLSSLLSTSDDKAMTPTNISTDISAIKSGHSFFRPWLEY